MADLKTTKEERAKLSKDLDGLRFVCCLDSPNLHEGKCFVGTLRRAVDDLDTLVKENEALRAVLASQAEMIESDVAAADQHGKGGQQAGIPRLVVTPPSVRDYLRRIARELREALAEVPR